MIPGLEFVGFSYLDENGPRGVVRPDVLERITAACADRDGARRIEMGAGYSATPGYLHLDINPNARPDIIGSADAERLPWPDGTFEALRAVDILEHLSWQDTGRVLAEWARILAPGATGYVMVPDAGTIMTRYAERPTSLVVPHLAEYPPIVSAAWRIMGGHLDDGYAKPGDDWRWNAHYACFDEQSLRWYLDRAGFIVDDIARNAHPNLIAKITRR